MPLIDKKLSIFAVHIVARVSFPAFDANHTA